MGTSKAAEDVFDALLQLAQGLVCLLHQMASATSIIRTPPHTGERTALSSVPLILRFSKDERSNHIPG